MFYMRRKKIFQEESFLPRKQSGNFLFLKEGFRKEWNIAGRDEAEIFTAGKGLGRFDRVLELTRKFQTLPGSVQEDLEKTRKDTGRKIPSWELNRKTRKKTRKESGRFGKDKEDPPKTPQLSGNQPGRNQEAIRKTQGRDQEGAGRNQEGSGSNEEGSGSDEEVQEVTGKVSGSDQEGSGRLRK